MVSLGAATTAGAAPKRTADTTTYTSASYLRQALGLPAKPKLVIESVTYDRFQWLLQQPGEFAFLVGDPATDPTFAARAQDVEAVAESSRRQAGLLVQPEPLGQRQAGQRHAAQPRHPQPRRHHLDRPEHAQTCTARRG